MALPLTEDLADRQTITCSPIHLLVARGTTEPPGNGLMRSLAQLIISDQGPGKADQEAIDYPATGLGNYNAYMDSVAQGSQAVTQQVTSYAKNCPNSRIVLLGYSQGAQIIGDALCGTVTKSASIDRSIGSHVHTIVLYGDPSFRVGEPYDKGTSTSNGIFSQLRTAGSCLSYAPLMSSYCDVNDSFCASGKSNIVHTGYFAKYNNNAAEFVISTIG
ncbi:hypothetical protein ETB97_008413 [Aspergillus alliaceus]|uniref:Cutinase n=1 Tax=Petromyces alliaceus TaxID=209559 RepID=A0A8H6E1F9_PETAA|nr:hypothetical protein ETB97_008413 [Aspergillus burnettii]